MNKSNYIVALLLLILVVFNSLRVSMTYVYFELDPIGFIENLCENTDKPELECNGKCQLMKVAKSQNKKQDTPDNIIDFKELLLFTNTIEPIVFLKKEYIEKQNPTGYQNLYSFTNSYDCFQPPRV
ncbi:hypothetical protein [uncultured Algibacter sp.]|uniref:hypothetical protein n=1 Tax=uncultured Algibacter sp. TaxID=298659 RepID=UPI00261CF7ED|nr:hypothetical protein [uncultured Algibacter sp.]